MKTRTILLFATALILACPVAEAQSSGLFGRNREIRELKAQLDSLQRAYDSLYVDYQAILEPVNADEIQEDDSTYVDFGTPYSPESIDSLFVAYHDHQLQSFIGFPFDDFEEIERDSLTTNIPDSVFIERLNRMTSFIPLTFNRYVKNNIIRYTEKFPSVTARIISVAPYYLPQFEEIFDEYEMPVELKAMAVIESALNPKAVSRAKAKGMWQFMYTTGLRYGLNITSFVDERYDPVTACRAAAQYLKDSYMIFGDWSLAIASYNCGAGNVRKAIHRSGGKTDFWEIYNYLPRETRGYIPAFIAALYVLQYYPEHGIVPYQVQLPSHIDTFHINRMLHFEQVSENIGISVETLRELNPQYLHDIVPGTEREYILRLPYNYSGLFADREEEIYKYKDTLYFNPVAIDKIKEGGSTGSGQRVIHTVRKGETLSSIARRYNTSVDNIRRWNGIRGNTIRVGQKLSIYGKSSGKSGGKSGGKNVTTDSSGSQIYTVRKGDTLSSIAKKNGMSLNSLLKLNNLTTQSKIYPGMKIRVK